MQTSTRDITGSFSVSVLIIVEHSHSVQTALSDHTAHLQNGLNEKNNCSPRKIKKNRSYFFQFLLDFFKFLIIIVKHSEILPTFFCWYNEEFPVKSAVIGHSSFLFFFLHPAPDEYSVFSRRIRSKFPCFTH